MPIASTMANSDSWLIEKPTAYIPSSVPSSAVGTTRVGISVARKFCRNTSITRNTSATASMSVMATSRIATLMKVVESNAQNQLTPAGKLGRMSFILADTALLTSSALASGDSWMPKCRHRGRAHVGFEAVLRGAQTDDGHILQPHGGAIRFGAQQDVLELLGS